MECVFCEKIRNLLDNYNIETGVTIKMTEVIAKTKQTSFCQYLLLRT